jgi:hypothetical protein
VLALEVDAWVEAVAEKADLFAFFFQALRRPVEQQLPSHPAGQDQFSPDRLVVLPDPFLLAGQNLFVQGFQKTPLVFGAFPLQIQELLFIDSHLSTDKNIPFRLNISFFLARLLFFFALLFLEVI